MKRADSIALFCSLGQELQSFGYTPESRDVIERSIAENEWFTIVDILRAVEAIRVEMLDKERLQRWAEHYPTATTPKRVAVIMAGNIPLVGFFDLLCVILSGHECHIKPSSKDSVLMRYVVARLRALDSDIPIYDYVATERYDMAIATGGDDANRYFRDHFAGTRALLRGSRHSVAILDGKETEAELQALTTDITAYSGLGCRSIAMLFVPRSTKLHIPHSAIVNRKMENSLRSLRALYTMQGIEYGDHGAFITLRGNMFPTRLGVITVTEYDDIAEVRAWLHDNSDLLQCVASHIDIKGAVPLGRAQYPTLWDYADGIDTMSWLTEEGIF